MLRAAASGTRQESLDLAGPAGRLEALLMLPEETPLAAGVVCHAHPLHGGMMHFKVVFRAAKALQQNRVAALRFNFRGVGRSQGSHDHGRGEQDDVRAALDEMERRFPTLPLVLGGFSFGSCMALRVGVEDPRVRALFALGVPLSLLPDTPALEGCRKPRLFVQGENDVFGSGEQVREMVERLPGEHLLKVVPGADHLFTGHLDAVQEAVSAWAATRPWEVS
jgi:alpha/beta superfamily hydrolase